MMTTLQQYSAVVRFGVQNALAYRVNFFIQAIFNLIPLFTGLAVWRTIYGGGKEVIAGYTASQMLSYYLIAAMVDACTSTTEDDWQIAPEIKDGRVSQFLVKPFSYLSYRLCMFASSRSIFCLAAAAPIAFLLITNSEVLTPCPNIWRLLAFGAAVLCSALNQFLLTFLTATLAFWVLEISSFSFILLALQRLAGGLMYPLDILPGPLHNFLLWTPFASQIYIPVEIYLGRVQGPQLVQYLGLEILWIVVLYQLACTSWKVGVRSYGAVGG